MRKFALAGNPNSGKTTLFNALTGSTAHVGNWPGVTVDKREGVCKRCAEPVAIVDLPGIYSLSPYTPEEVIARSYILEEKPDCIIDIVDATRRRRAEYVRRRQKERRPDRCEKAGKGARRPRRRDLRLKGRGHQRADGALPQGRFAGAAGADGIGRLFPRPCHRRCDHRARRPGRPKSPLPCR